MVIDRRERERGRAEDASLDRVIPFSVPQATYSAGGTGPGSDEGRMEHSCFCSETVSQSSVMQC